MSDLETIKASQPTEVHPSANMQPTETKSGPIYIFKAPEKIIKTPVEMDLKWTKSETYYDILGFISTLSYIVQGKKNSHSCELSEPVKKLLEMIKSMEELAKNTPPINQPARFGNAAFRSWFEKMKNNSSNYLKEILPENLQDAAQELIPYLIDSFGNPTRIDYGTGHELNFLLFLIGLFKIGVLVKDDEIAVVLKVFDAYLNFVRKLQVTYRMEPAGSHGVWSLDDFQFVPFIFGSAQLAVNSPIEPAQFVEDEIINEYRKEFMFISCIDYIRQVKTGHFAEHSNQLWSISAVQSWSKISTGLIKMYQKEVLSKFPVIQHVLFGSIFTLNSVKPGTKLPQVRLGYLPQTQKPPPPPTFSN